MTVANIVLSVGTMEGEDFEACLKHLIPMFGHVELSPLTRYYKCPRQEALRDADKGIWIRGGVIFPSDMKALIQRCVNSITKYRIPIETVIIPCFEHLIDLTKGFLVQQFDQAREETIRRGKEVPQWKRPKLWGIASLTFEDRELDVKIRERIERAAALKFNGVIVPPDMVEYARHKGLKTAVASIRDPDFPVKNDYQAVTYTPEEAREANPDYYFVGTQIIQMDTAPKMIEMAKTLIFKLNGEGNLPG